jgi:hypothetical protein
MKIADVEVNIEAQRKNTPEERANIFAHLKGLDKTKAVAELEKALKAPAAPVAPAPATPAAEAKK